jgi:tryptophan synthase alpha chain
VSLPDARVGRHTPGVKKPGGSYNTSMNPIDSLFARLRSQSRKAFIPFVPAADPDLAFTAAALPAVAAAGASLIELGVPFSDPIADGPVIQASYTRALKGGFKLDAMFDTVKGVTSTAGWDTPMVAMGSYSLIHKRGPEAFIDACLGCGLSGAVVPDLPAEEADELAKRCRDRDFKLVLLVTPTTTPERMAKIAAACGGFVYVVSVVGITGQRAAAAEAVGKVTAKLRTMTDLPLCVGFGVSKPEHVRELAPVCDGVIVGTALVKHLETAATDRAAALDGIAKQVRELSGALPR